MDEDEDDRSLLERWRAGDLVAGKRLLDPHFRPLMRFFLDKVGHHGADLVQHTLFVCRHGGVRSRHDSSFRTYLFQTARDVLYEHIRRHRDAAFDPEEVSLAELGLSPSTAYAQDLQQRTLLEALQRIPLEDQIALELYFMEGLSGPELAVVLDVPEAAVPRRIRRGRDRLRAQMETLHGA